jgi:hypothetical protein
MMAAAGMAARYLAPMAMQAGAGLAAGKLGENVGGYNEQQSAQERLKARMLNEDPNAQGGRQEMTSTNAANAQQGRSRADLILANQLDSANKRADLQNTMTANDQVINANRGTQLADNYVQSSRDQAQASGNLFNAIMNRQATQYGNLGLR